MEELINNFILIKANAIIRGGEKKNHSLEVNNLQKYIITWIFNWARKKKKKNSFMHKQNSNVLSVQRFILINSY